MYFTDEIIQIFLAFHFVTLFLELRSSTIDAVAFILLWKVLILRDLLPGTKRFGELKKSIGNVTQKVLTSQLRGMEESGLISRKVYAEVPPRVELREYKYPQLYPR